MSSWLGSYGALFVLGVGAVGGCTNDAPPSSTNAPTPGDLGPSATPETVGDDVGPRADNPAPMRKDKAAGLQTEPAPIDPKKMDPATFEAKAVCLLPKLSMCSAYGAQYERLASVPQFCNALGGEKAAACPDESRVAKCMTPANVLTSYYSSGEKPYTKETAEAKCSEKNWIVVP